MTNTPTLQARIEAALTDDALDVAICAAMRSGGDTDDGRWEPIGAAAVMRGYVLTQLSHLLADAEREHRALLSIANSACCGCCQEAALVARAALAAEARHE